MNAFNFADRYAQAGIAPGADIVAARQAPADRILKDLTGAQLFDLVGVYLGHPALDMTWFRDEFRKEDAAFSLVNNERECAILAATILGAKVAEGNAKTILALLTASIAGKRAPKEATWLLDEARGALLRFSVSNRRSKPIEPKLEAAVSPKLEDEIAALGANDWPNLLAVLKKARAEAQDATSAISTQASTALSSLAKDLKYTREETQILWWLFGEHSRTLNRHFSTFPPGQTAVIAGIELGELSTASALGPVAAPAVLERVLRLAGKEKTQQKSLAVVLDGIAPNDINALKIYSGRPSRIFPIMTAIDKARQIGPGSWQGVFEKETGLEAKSNFEPIELATQVYREHLLGQVL